MAKVIKELRGHSGSLVYLMENGEKFFVKKRGNTERNYERLIALFGYVDIPEIYFYDSKEDILEMEYIPGEDMNTYLLYNSVTELNRFLFNTIDLFAQNSVEKDYTLDYITALAWMKEDEHPFPFTVDELIERLPLKLPQSIYHGDMTLENIIHRKDGRFFFIDPVTVPYDSWVFDLAKLRQDLECKWFLRNETSYIDVKLGNIQEFLLNKFPVANNDYLLILMLLRVYRHCVKDSLEYKFIVKEVNRLWK